MLCREFLSGILNEDNVFNADETHYVIRQHKHKTIAIRRENGVKYADVVSKDDGIIMMVLTSGDRNSNAYPQFLILKNENRSYPI